MSSIAHAAIPILLLATCLTWLFERITTAPVEDRDER